MESKIKKILICEDHQIVIDGLLSIFKTQDDYKAIAFIKNGEEILPAAKFYSPDAILLDLNLPQKNGLDVLKELKQQCPDIKVIVLTMYNKESMINEVIKQKGDGFLLKNCTTEELFKALDSVFESNHFFRGIGVSKEKSINERDDFLNKINITRREKEIIFELTQGLSVPQISEKLFISTYTVETHKKNIFKKLNIHNSIDLVTFANESNLFS